MRVLFFGRLGDYFGPARDMEIGPDKTVAEVIDLIGAGDAQAIEVLSRNSTAYILDNMRVKGDARIGAAAELAFLPPASGG